MSEISRNCREAGVVSVTGNDYGEWLADYKVPEVIFLYSRSAQRADGQGATPCLEGPGAERVSDRKLLRGSEIKTGLA